MSGPREVAVLAAVEAYLKCRGDCVFWRNNTGAYSPRPGQFIKFGHEGSGDFIGCIGPTGRMFSVECKRPQGGKVSAAQERFGARLVEAGGIYVVARSVAEVEAALPPVAVELTRTRVVPR